MPTEYWSAADSESYGGFSPPTYDQWTRVGSGGNKANSLRVSGLYSSVSHDDATSYLYWNTYQTWGYQEFALDFPGPIGAVSAVTHGQRMKHINNGNSTCNFWLMQSGSPSNAVGGQTFDEDWTNYGPSATTRPGGGDWLTEDFDTENFASGVLYGRIGAYPDANANAQRQVTSVWGQITYDPPAGGMIFILGLTGALPLVGTLTDIGQLVKFVAWRRRYHWRHTLLRPDEIRKAWAELCVYKHPRFFSHA